VTARTGRSLRAHAACVLMALVVPPLCCAAPPTPAELTKLCTDAEDQAHCGRLVEAPRSFAGSTSYSYPTLAHIGKYCISGSIFKEIFHRWVCL